MINFIKLIFWFYLFGSQKEREDSPFKNYKARDYENYEHSPINPVIELAGKFAKWLHKQLYPQETIGGEEGSTQNTTSENVKEKEEINNRTDSVDRKVEFMSSDGDSVVGTYYERISKKTNKGRRLPDIEIE